MEEVFFWSCFFVFFLSVFSVRDLSGFYSKVQLFLVNYRDGQRETQRQLRRDSECFSRSLFRMDAFNKNGYLY